MSTLSVEMEMECSSGLVNPSILEQKALRMLKSIYPQCMDRVVFTYVHTQLVNSDGLSPDVHRYCHSIASSTDIKVVY
jgi:hypothetical protein